jgi:hypothetical protein
MSDTIAEQPKLPQPETIFKDKRSSTHPIPPTGHERRHKNNEFGNHWYLSATIDVEEITELPARD